MLGTVKCGPAGVPRHPKRHDNRRMMIYPNGHWEQQRYVERRGWVLDVNARQYFLPSLQGNCNVPQPPETPAARASPDLTEVIACPGCNRRLLGPVDKGPLTVRCPKCDCTWTVYEGTHLGLDKDTCEDCGNGARQHLMADGQRICHACLVDRNALGQYLVDEWHGNLGTQNVWTPEGIRPAKKP